MEFVDELQHLGLTRNEAKIYTAILSKGAVRVSQICEDADIATGKVYDILQSMRRKGLISIVVKNGVKTISASPPSAIQELLQRKERELAGIKERATAILPVLTAAYTAQTQPYEFEVFTGTDGLRAAVDKVSSVLARKEDILCLAVADRNPAVEIVWKRFAQMASKRACSFKFITAQSKTESKGLWLLHEFHAEHRLVRLPTVSPITITQQYVLINDYPSSSHILIRSPTVTAIFRTMFSSLWAYGEKPVRVRKSTTRKKP